MLSPELLEAEWLETDGWGGFSSGTVGGWRTRRYHGLLTPAIDPPTRRAVMVASHEAWVERGGVRTALSAHRYGTDVTHPDGHRRLVAFERSPWPRWTWELADGLRVMQELLVPDGLPAVVLRWRALGDAAGARLVVRPFLAGRDSHSMHHENATAVTAAEQQGERVRWRPYGALPTVVSAANASYRHEPLWYRDVLLSAERDRGFDHHEDLLSPGELTWDLGAEDAVWLLYAEGLAGSEALASGRARTLVGRLMAREDRRRRAFPSELDRAADQYLVRRGEGRTIIAGYPWFTDWGRDTFIALRGLCLAGDRLAEAGDILLEWSSAVSEGMLPNRFVEAGDAPEFNAVDASLWYVIAVHEYLDACAARRRRLASGDEQRLHDAAGAILDGYTRGTRYQIRMTDDGLLQAGAPGVQLTWMDARVGDWVVTPRIGKPVEIQALWINALRLAGRRQPEYGRMADHAMASFNARFVNVAPVGLPDVVDADHVEGKVDAAFRPNQIFAVGGLPFPLLEGAPARAVVDAVEALLWTPLGLRSLAPGEPGYAGRYEGGPVERDGAYHQGTVWPWLIGPFVDAWVRVRGRTPEAVAEARARFLTPLFDHLEVAGLGHVSEIADGDAPYTPRGCPFQAWSLGELLRLDRRILAPPAAEPRRARLSRSPA